MRNCKTNSSRSLSQDARFVGDLSMIIEEQLLRAVFDPVKIEIIMSSHSRLPAEKGRESTGVWIAITAIIDHGHNQLDHGHY
jgi:hypothetical protein